MNPSTFRKARALLMGGAVLLACAGWLAGQRTYHGV